MAMRKNFFFAKSVILYTKHKKYSFNAVYKNGKKSYGRAKNSFKKCHTIYETKNSVSKLNKKGGSPCEQFQ